MLGGQQRFICTICGKHYTTTYNMRQHKNIHSGAGLHTCRYCGRDFTHKHVWEVRILQLNWFTKLKNYKTWIDFIEYIYFLVYILYISFCNLSDEEILNSLFLLSFLTIIAYVMMYSHILCIEHVSFASFRLSYDIHFRIRGNERVYNERMHIGNAFEDNDGDTCGTCVENQKWINVLWCIHIILNKRRKTNKIFLSILCCLLVNNIHSIIARGKFIFTTCRRSLSRFNYYMTKSMHLYLQESHMQRETKN